MVHSVRTSPNVIKFNRKNIVPTCYFNIIYYNEGLQISVSQINLKKIFFY